MGRKLIGTRQRSVMLTDAQYEAICRIAETFGLKVVKGDSEMGSISYLMQAIADGKIECQISKVARIIRES